MRFSEQKTKTKTKKEREREIGKHLIDFCTYTISSRARRLFYFLSTIDLYRKLQLLACISGSCDFYLFKINFLSGFQTLLRATTFHNNTLAPCLKVIIDKLPVAQLVKTSALFWNPDSNEPYIFFLQALNFLVESFGLLIDLFPLPSILDAGYPVFDLHLANVLFDVILPSVLGSSL